MTNRKFVPPYVHSNWLQNGAMPLKNTDDVSYLARTNFRLQNKLFGIKQADRLSHIYMIGKTGVGKSTLIETLARRRPRCWTGLCAY